MKNKIKNRARIANRCQSKEDKIHLVYLAMLNGIKINEELKSLYDKKLILDSDSIYYLNDELIIPGFNEEEPVPSYNGNGVEEKIVDYSELMSYLIRENKEHLELCSIKHNGVLIDCYYIFNEFEFTLKYVMLGNTNITDLVDLETIEIDLENKLINSYE
jgi:hypothetical protein